MQKEQLSPKKMIRIGLMILAIGLVLGVIGGVLIYNHNKKMKTYISISSVVVNYATNIEHYDSYDQYEIYAPIVEYEVEGKKYYATYPIYSKSKTPLGSKIMIRYNKNKPEDVIFEKDKRNIAVPIVAGVFIVAGFALIIVGNVKSRKEKGIF